MRTVFTFLIILFFGIAVSAQTLLYSENFELTSAPDSVSYVGTGVWGKSSTLFAEGVRSDSMRIVNPGD